MLPVVPRRLQQRKRSPNSRPQTDPSVVADLSRYSGTTSSKAKAAIAPSHQR
ncbi:hypothetical protein [Nodosilinea sp. FACHB-13]|uniref:hypothetical protein n=1 Tax=Nodosilinea sp. FACHB-13 TaxID=2692831 RepID=UPI00168200E4|nr:hypothetical protein [Nodosilinea sp. FACHB-13]MBD2107890.1 hypothetical protein [Nodosilinea sp. FACHB-13]